MECRSIGLIRITALPQYFNTLMLLRRLRLLGFALCALLFELCSIAEAQQLTKVPRIGYLSGSPPSSITARTEAFRQGLRDLGYVEGKTIAIEWRFGEGKRDRFPAVAADLVRLKVDVIVTAGPLVTRAAKQANSKIPNCHGAGSRSGRQRIRCQPRATWR